MLLMVTVQKTRVLSIGEPRATAGHRFSVVLTVLYRFAPKASWFHAFSTNTQKHMCLIVTFQKARVLSIGEPRATECNSARQPPIPFHIEVGTLYAYAYLGNSLDEILVLGDEPCLVLGNGPDNYLDNYLDNVIYPGCHFKGVFIQINL